MCQPIEQIMIGGGACFFQALQPEQLPLLFLVFVALLLIALCRARK
jgi:hypothetical protein